jgi:hypothetical protein
MVASSCKKLVLSVRLSSRRGLTPKSVPKETCHSEALSAEESDTVQSNEMAVSVRYPIPPQPTLSEAQWVGMTRVKVVGFRGFIHTNNRCKF